MISFLVTCKNELVELTKLLPILDEYIKREGYVDEIVILDDYSDGDTLSFINNFMEGKSYVRHIQHALDSDFGANKTFGNSHCLKPYIFQIDADEYPTDFLLNNLKVVLETNKDIELFFVPRVNIVTKLTPEMVQHYGWRISTLQEFGDTPIVNFHDPQSRIYRNLPTIKWNRPLHETIVGAKIIAHLPSEAQWSLIHIKSAERQIKQNNRYNKNWSQSDNIRKS